MIKCCCSRRFLSEIKAEDKRRKISCFQKNSCIHSEVCSFAVYLPPYTRHSPWSEGFICGAMADNKLTEKCRKIFPNYRAMKNRWRFVHFIQKRTNMRVDVLWLMIKDRRPQLPQLCLFRKKKSLLFCNIIWINPIIPKIFAYLKLAAFLFLGWRK